MKKLVLFLFIVVSLWIIIIYKEIVFYPLKLTVFGHEIPVNTSKLVDNFYIKYIAKRNENPVYVWKNDVFRWYAEDCHKKIVTNINWSGNWKPTSCLIFPHQQTYSDIVWLTSIQYIWSVVDSHKATYLYDLLDNLTNINPYWDFPYLFWQLLIPWAKFYKNSSNEDLMMKTWNNSIKIWQKALNYNCDNTKIDAIFTLTDTQYSDTITNKNWENYKKIKNPCDTSEFATSIGFNYYYYLWNYLSWAEYYKIWAFNEDAPRVIPSMYAIIKWKWWQHAKSMIIWFSKYLSLNEQYQESINAEEKTLYLDKMWEAERKATLEYHLDVISSAGNVANNRWECIEDYDCLEEKWYINWIVADELGMCKNIQSSDKSIDLIEKSIINVDDSENHIRCILLSNWLTKEYFYKWEDWYFHLNYPQKTDEDNNMTYWWDKESNWRRIMSK